MTDQNYPVWGAKEIAREIGRTERQTVHLLAKGHLPAKRVGNRWVSTHAALREFLDPSAGIAAKAGEAR